MTKEQLHSLERQTLEAMHQQALAAEAEAKVRARVACFQTALIEEAIEGCLSTSPEP